MPKRRPSLDLPRAPTLTALKRRIDVLEDKVAKAPDQPYLLREGRVICRLVSLTDRVTDLIAEHERRVILAGHDGRAESLTPSEAEDRAFRAYKELIHWCPEVKRLMKTAKGRKRDTTWQDLLQRGAFRARADDTNTLKSSVIIWLNEQHPYPVPPFSITKKQGRGFDHEVTGRLLSPVDYNWSNPIVRAALRDHDPDYIVTAHMWPRFVYQNGRYDQDLPSKGLFKGGLLVRAFRCIFTGPNSAHESLTSDDEQPHPNRVVRTRRNVAKLSDMQTVEPRAIAYVAVQLRFALSNCTSWSLQDNNFNYEAFYHNIVDWFECPRSAAKAEEIDDLLDWWTAAVFDPRRSPTFESQEPNENLSVVMSMEY